jgi:pSer/pThr/pTyr-binding forkhead associated (FHA) protein
MPELAHPRLVVVRDGTRLTELPLPPGSEVVVGRSEGCTIPIPDGSVSRLHARIVADEAGVHVEDLGSANGTYVDGRRLSGRLRIINGQEVRVAQKALSNPTVVMLEEPALTQFDETGSVVPRTFQAGDQTLAVDERQATATDRRSEGPLTPTLPVTSLATDDTWPTAGRRQPLLAAATIVVVALGLAAALGWVLTLRAAQPSTQLSAGPPVAASGTSGSPTSATAPASWPGAASATQPLAGHWSLRLDNVFYPTERYVITLALDLQQEGSSISGSAQSAIENAGMTIRVPPTVARGAVLPGSPPKVRLTMPFGHPLGELHLDGVIDGAGMMGTFRSSATQAPGTWRGSRLAEGVSVQPN